MSGAPQRQDCAPWCSGNHASNPACWEFEWEHYVSLSLEAGYPLDSLPGLPAVGGHDVPRIGGCAYRSEPGYWDVVYLHIYRPSDLPHRDLDVNLKISTAEARQLAAGLIALADQIDSYAKTTD